MAADASSACAFAQTGTEVGLRVRWEEALPLGGCTGEAQERSCDCATGACGAWSGGFAAPVCRAGCGDRPHGGVRFEERRTRYATPLGDCRAQVQGRGRACEGRYGAPNASDSAYVPRGWCPVEGEGCAAATAPFFLHTACVPLPAGPPPPFAPPSSSRDAVTPGEPIIVLASVVAAGIFLPITLVLVLARWRRWRSVAA